MSGCFRFHFPRRGVDQVRDWSQTLSAAAVQKALEQVRRELPQHIADEFLGNERVKNLTQGVLENNAFKPGDGRAFYNSLVERTGFTSVRYDCCRNSCLSFTMYPDDDECSMCGQSRWLDPNAKNRVAAKSHVYFPIRHRLMLWFSSKFMSRLLKSYKRKAIATSLIRHRSRAGRSTTSRTLTDVWSGKIYQILRKKGFFDGTNDLGFCAGFDGTKAFKTRKDRFVWPIILTCLNLPPEIRYKRKNVLVAGFVPGPKNPKNLDSFLTPLVEEFEILTDGIEGVWDAGAEGTAKNKTFKMRAYLVLVTTDMVARAKILHLMGMHSSCYCEYCQINGLQYGGMHCPHKPPENLPQEVIDQQRKKIAEDRPCYNWQKEYVYDNSLLREDEQFRMYARYVKEHGDNDPNFAERVGISGESIFTRLPTLLFPWSFPPCTMHLFYENIAKSMFEHLAGRFFVKRPPPVVKESGPAEPPPTSKGRRSALDPPPPRLAPAFSKRNTTEGPFLATSDPYNIHPKLWKQIGSDTAKSNVTYPDQLGEEMTNLETTFRKMKAANWERFLYHQSPVYFRKCLPKEHYNEWMNMVEAMRLATRKELCDFEIDEVSFNELFRRSC